MRIINKELITKLVSEVIKDTDLFITDVNVKKGGVIYVFLDGDTGVSIDACIQVSRYVEKHLDREKEDFELNVSSNGIGRPFVVFRQYKNAEGKMISVKLNDDTKIKGILKEAKQDHILIEIPGSKKNPPALKDISMQDIKETKLEVVFNKI